MLSASPSSLNYPGRVILDWGAAVDSTYHSVYADSAHYADTSSYAIHGVAASKADSLWNKGAYRWGQYFLRDDVPDTVKKWYVFEDSVRCHGTWWWQAGRGADTVIIFPYFNKMIYVVAGSGIDTPFVVHNDPAKLSAHFDGRTEAEYSTADSFLVNGPFTQYTKIRPTEYLMKFGNVGSEDTLWIQRYSFYSLWGSVNWQWRLNTVFGGAGAGDSIRWLTSTAAQNSFYGAGAGYYCGQGSYNTAIGFCAGQHISADSHNTYIGYNAAHYLLHGSMNTVLGAGAMDHSLGGYDDTANVNIIIGHNAFYDDGGDSNVIIGNQALASSAFKINKTFYLDNKNTATPLMYGRFDSHYVRIDTVVYAKWFHGWSDSATYAANAAAAKKADSLYNKGGYVYGQYFFRDNVKDTITDGTDSIFTFAATSNIPYYTFSTQAATTPIRAGLEIWRGGDYGLGVLAGNNAGWFDASINTGVYGRAGTSYGVLGYAGAKYGAWFKSPNVALVADLGNTPTSDTIAQFMTRSVLKSFIDSTGALSILGNTGYFSNYCAYITNANGDTGLLDTNGFKSVVNGKERFRVDSKGIRLRDTTFVSTSALDTVRWWMSNDTLIYKSKLGSFFLDLRQTMVLFKPGWMLFDQMKPATNDSASSSLGDLAAPYGKAFVCSLRVNGKQPYAFFTGKANFRDTLLIPKWNNKPASGTVGSFALDTAGTDTIWAITEGGIVAVYPPPPASAAMTQAAIIDTLAANIGTHGGASSGLFQGITNDINVNDLACVVLGGTNDSCLNGADYSGIVAGKDLRTDADYNFLGGGGTNKVTTTTYSAIIGGSYDSITGASTYAVMVGGLLNGIVGATESFTAGGDHSRNKGGISYIICGSYDSTLANNSGLLGSQFSSINTAGTFSQMIGGSYSYINSANDFIAMGYYDTIPANSPSSFILSPNAKIRAAAGDSCDYVLAGGLIDSCMKSLVFNCVLKKLDSTFAVSKQLYVIDGADTSWLRGGSIGGDCWANRNAPANHLTDTLVIAGIAATDRFQLTWYGATPAIYPLRERVVANTLFVYIETADTTKARAEGYVYLRMTKP